MSISSNQKRFISFFIVSLFLFLSNIDTYAQCGVYTKRAYTTVFPYSKVHIGQSADMNNDGSKDLILASEDSSSIFLRNRIFVLPNNGDGTFGQPTIITAPAQNPFYDKIFIGRVNNDSLLDILVYFGRTPSAAQAYINNGDGTFTPQPIFTGGLSNPIYFLDINNDGKDDHVGFRSSVFEYRLGNGDGTFGNSVAMFQNSIGYPGDFNHDGKVDFLKSGNFYINQGDGTFVPINANLPSTNRYISGIQDVNGDGWDDIMLSNSSGFTVLLQTGTSFEATNYNFSGASNNSQSGYLGNFIGNSATDILFDTKFPYGKIVYENDGSGNFTRRDFGSNFTSYHNYYFHETLMDDFDNDGKTDYLIATSGLSNSTLVFRDKTSFTLLKNVCNRVGQPRIVDFDSSGTTDFSFWNPDTGDWTYQTSSSDFNERQTRTVNWGLGSMGDIPMPGDFDGDGITDHSVYRNSTGVWYIRRSSDSQWLVFQFGLSGDKPVAADYDGDTITDIAVWRPSDGNWYIWHMGTQQFTSYHWGSDGDKPAPADYDGDLKTDLAVFRPSTGAWYYLKSSDGNYVARQWGIGADRPVPADFDGDGKADLAVYRDSDNTFYMIKSYDNSFVGYKWGNPQDVPFVGDFDGDFVADFGVYRPSTKVWWQTNVLLNGATIGTNNGIITSTIPRIE